MRSDSSEGDVWRDLGSKGCIFPLRGGVRRGKVVMMYDGTFISQVLFDVERPASLDEDAYQACPYVLLALLDVVPAACDIVPDCAMPSDARLVSSPSPPTHTQICNHLTSPKLLPVSR